MGKFPEHIIQIDTADGSKSLYNTELDETYHSRHGALQEAVHVFINHGFLQRIGQKKTIRILEMGLGTGLNAILTWIEAERKGLSVEYCALESFILPTEMIAESNFFSEDWSSKTLQLFSAEWGLPQTLDSSFSIQKINGLVEEIDLSTQEPFDLIYFDAFGPRVQPHLWTVPIFEKFYNALAPGGLFVTYCAKGQVRRDLQSVGFTMERLPGPPGKREMLRGTKPKDTP
jgi:tRNA U34 5-methylaminomethyl-2-thiouridine-forming methyltransferase MnmC